MIRLQYFRSRQICYSGKVYYISFNIPRRNPGFDPSLYPPVECGEPALTYDKWVGRENAEPVKKGINRQ